IFSYTLIIFLCHSGCRDISGSSISIIELLAFKNLRDNALINNCFSPDDNPFISNSLPVESLNIGFVSSSFDRPINFTFKSIQSNIEFISLHIFSILFLGGKSSFVNTSVFIALTIADGKSLAIFWFTSFKNWYSYLNVLSILFNSLKFISVGI